MAAGIFALLSVVQIRALPARRHTATPQRAGDQATDEPRTGQQHTGNPQAPRAQWRGILANRPFLLFSTAMVGSYVLAFQIYLALPLEVRRLGGDGTFDTAAVAALFAVSGLSTIAFQTKVTAWCKARMAPGAALVWGLITLGTAFLPLLLATAAPVPRGGPGLWLLAAVPPSLSALLLALGTMIAFPFERDTIVRLAGNRLVATHYGRYKTICGIGITLAATSSPAPPSTPPATPAAPPSRGPPSSPWA